MLYYIIFKVQEKMIEVGKSTTGIKRAVGIWAKKTGDELLIVEIKLF